MYQSIKTLCAWVLAAIFTGQGHITGVFLVTKLTRHRGQPTRDCLRLPTGRSRQAGLLAHAYYNIWGQILGGCDMVKTKKNIIFNKF